MAEEVAALFVKMEARTRELEKGLARAEKKTAAAMKNVRKSVKGSGAAFDQLSAKVKLLGTTFLTTKVLAYADSFKSLQNALRQVAGSEEEVIALTDELYKVAQRSRGAIGDTADTFKTLVIATDGLNLSQAELIRLTETIQKAAPGASGAVKQLGQALGAGALRGDELNSVLEGAPLIARAVAKEFGVTIGQLRELAAEGEVTTDRVIAALKTLGTQADANIAKTKLTVTQALTALDNAFTVFIGGQDSALGATDALAAGLVLLAENLDTVADAFAVIATVIAGRYAGAAVTAAISKTAALTAGVGALGVRAGTSAIAMRALSSAMAFFGGPVGFAITAIVGSMAVLAGNAREAQAEFQRLVAPVGDVEGGIMALEKAAQAYAQAIADVANTQSDATDSIVASTKKEFEAKKALLQLEVERREAANRERTAAIKQHHADAEYYLDAYSRGKDGKQAWQRDVASAHLETANDHLSKSKELQARRDLAEISIEGAKKVLAMSFEDLAAQAGPITPTRTGGGGTSTTTKTKATKSTVSAEQKAAAQAAEDLAEAKVAEARAAENLEHTMEALGGWESQRAASARDLMESAERTAAVERAREDVLRKGGSQELADATARTLELEQKREVALDVLTEKERFLEDRREAAADLAEQRIRDEEKLQKETDEAREARAKRLNEFLSDAHKTRMEEQKKEAAEFGAALIEEMEANLEYMDALKAADERREKQVRETNKAIADGLIDAVAEAENFEDALKKVLVQLLKIAASGFADGLTGGTGSDGGILGSIFESLGSGLASFLPSFDGGGGTGSGARVGGMDGKGGFPAILHPNEHVIDFTKGGTPAGGSPVSIVNNNTYSAGLNGADKAQIAAAIKQSEQRTVRTVQDIRDRSPSYLR